MVAFLFTGTVAFAQSGLQFGLRYDPEYTAYSNSNDAGAGDELQFASHFTELSFGGGAVYNFDKNMGIGIDILFSREGQAYTGTLSGTPPRADAYSSVVARQLSLNGMDAHGNYVALAEINYFKIPIMFSLTTDNSELFYFSVLAGPQFNVLHGVAQEVNQEDLDYPNTSVEPIDLYNSMTLGAVLALGASWNASSNIVLSTRLRFDYGLTDAENKDVTISTEGAPAVRFYSADRGAVHTETAGLLIGIDYKL